MDLTNIIHWYGDHEANLAILEPASSNPVIGLAWNLIQRLVSSLILSFVLSLVLSSCTHHLTNVYTIKFKNQ